MRKDLASSFYPEKRYITHRCVSYFINSIRYFLHVKTTEIMRKNLSMRFVGVVSMGQQLLWELENLKREENSQRKCPVHKSFEEFSIYKKRKKIFIIK